MRFGNQKLKFGLKVCLVSVIVGMLLGAYIAYSQSSVPTFTIGYGPYPSSPTYTVWADSGTYYAKNAYGATNYSGSDFIVFMQAIIDANNQSSKWIYLTSGDYQLGASSIVPRNGTKITGETNRGVKFYGSDVYGTKLRKVTGTSEPIFITDINTKTVGVEIGFMTLSLEFFEGARGISLYSASECYIHDVEIRNGHLTNSVGIYLSTNETLANATVTSDNTIERIFLDSAFYGIWLDGADIQHPVTNNVFRNIYMVNIYGIGVLFNKFADSNYFDYAFIGIAGGTTGYGVRFNGADPNNASKGVNSNAMEYLVIDMASAATYDIQIGNSTEPQYLLTRLTTGLKPYINRVSGAPIPIWTNIGQYGYKTENQGTINVPTGDGVTFDHGLLYTPTIVLLTPCLTGVKFNYNASATAITIKHDAGGTILFSWFAKFTT